ncbi:MAG: hypothetical protein LBV09_01195 [Deferribacteraceae bacterium]|jgi:flagellar biosynthesis/type III secretory pathway protein FliH|nr:hypothetical protein [Deferribacteraceae bacterium]
MSSKIIRPGSDKKFETMKIEHYSYIERGEKGFELETFDKGSLSVQDMTGQPKTQPETVHPSNSRRSLFSNFDDGSAPAANAPVNKYSFLDFLAEDKPEEKVDTHPTNDGFQEVDLSQAEEIGDELKVPESQKRLAEHNAEIKALEDKLAAQEAMNLEQAEFITALTTEKDAIQNVLEETKAQLKTSEESIPAIKTTANKEGYDSGYNKAKAEFDAKEMKQYEAQKADYMAILEKNWTEALQEIDKINGIINEVDKQMPEIIIAYVRELVGTERKLNDKIITGIISSALGKLKDLQQIVFTVNPDDAGTIAEKFPQYGVAIDPNIPKGGVKIRTKVGDVDVSLDSWMNELEKQINEQFAATKNN